MNNYDIHSIFANIGLIIFVGILTIMSDPYGTPKNKKKYITKYLLLTIIGAITIWGICKNWNL
jgi:hypothetical protein